MSARSPSGAPPSTGSDPSSPLGRVLRRFLEGLRPGRDGEESSRGWGYTLLELLMVLVIIGTLSTMAVPRLQRAREMAQVARAIGDIKALEVDILDYEVGNNQLPPDLGAVGREALMDPWGNPYQYLRIRGGRANRGAMRKDRFLVPLNSDFDLYSMGPDGESVPPLTARAGRDDIVRANNGGYVGSAEGY